MQGRWPRAWSWDSCRRTGGRHDEQQRAASPKVARFPRVSTSGASAEVLLHSPASMGVIAPAARGRPRLGPRLRAVPRAAAERVRGIPLVLGLLLAVAAIHATAWCFASAPLVGPDETSHAGYIQYLAETGHGPQRSSGDTALSTEMSQLLGRLNLGPIIGHLEGRPEWDAGGPTKRDLQAFSHDQRANGNGLNAAAINPPLYYLWGAAVYRLSPDTSLLGRLTAIRLSNVLLFVATVWVTWLIAAELFSRTWLLALGTALVALQPKLGYMAGVVNPDMMLTTLATGALLAAVRILRRGPTVGRSLALGLTTGGAILTQGRGLYLVPVLLLVMAYALWRAPVPWRPRLWMAVAGVGTMAVCGFIALAWTRSHSGGVAYGGQAPAVGGFNVRQFISYLWQFYLPKLSFMDLRPGPDYGYRQVYIQSYFGTFASLEVNYRDVDYDLLQVSAGLGLLGLYTAMVARWRAVLANWTVVALAVLTFLGMMAVLHIVSYANLRGGPDPVITGRYLLPCVSLYGLAAAGTVGSLPRRAGAVVAGILVSSALVLAIGGIALTAARFYA